MEKRKSRLLAIIFVVSVLLGLLLIIGPLIISNINQQRANQAIEAYRNAMNGQTQDNNEATFAVANRYNQAVTGSVKDDEILEQYNDILNLENGIMGYIEIPRINIRDPIYHGVEEPVLQKGIGHMPSTSFPVGGLGTHAALSGHRGLPSSKLFTDLDLAQEGDIILIHILDRTMAYEVYKIEIVTPDSAGNLEVEPDKDLLTLVTCTPYGVNSHRLLVHASRTDYKEEMNEIIVEHSISESDRILLIALGIVAVILALDIVIILKRRKRIRATKKMNA